MPKPFGDPKQYWNPYAAGALLGVVLFLAFFITGEGLGGSGGLNHVVVAVTDVIAPHYVETTRSVASTAAGDNTPLDNHYVYMLIGLLLGGFVSGLLNKRVKTEIRKGPRIGVPVRLTFAFIGGVLVGFAARLARGCTSGQALTGGAILSVGSWGFMIAVFAGGYLLAYPVRKLWT